MANLERNLEISRRAKMVMSLGNLQAYPKESFEDKWLGVGFDLDIPTLYVEQIRHEFNQGTICIHKAIHNLLEYWQLRHVEKEAIGELLSAMRLNDLDTYADKLEEEWLLADTEDLPVSTSVTCRCTPSPQTFKRQRVHIKDNKKKLVEKTKWDETLKSKLEEKKFLNKRDVEYLSKLSVESQKEWFYNIATGRAGSGYYDVILEAMEEAEQNEVANILREIQVPICT